jgi:hypothetical protein
MMNFTTKTISSIGIRLGGVIFGCFALQLNAQSVFQSGTFDGLSSNAIYFSTDAADPFTSFLETVIAPDFQKFNPSLGTLERVEFSVETTVTWFLSVQTSDVSDESQGSSFDFDNGVIDVGAFYEPTNGGGSIFTLTSDTSSGIQASASASAGDGPPFLENDPEETFGVTTFGEILTSSPEFDPVDFIGSGTITGLLVGMFIPLDNNWTLDNLESAEAALNYELDSGNISLEYFYTPVPEGSNYSLLLGVIALGFAASKRTGLWA